MFLSNLPADRRQRRLASAIIAVSTVVFLVLVPFAKVALRPVPAFIPIYQSALLVNDLITAVFLLGQRQLSRSQGAEPARRRLSVHCADVDRACANVSRFVRANRAARCRAADHGLALHFLARRLSALRHRLHAEMGWTEQPPGERRITIIEHVGFDHLRGLRSGATDDLGSGPTCRSIMQDNHYTPAMIIVVSAVWLLNLLALFCLVAPPALFRARSLADRDDVCVAVRHRLERGVQRRPLRSRFLCRPDLRAIGGEFRADRFAARERQALRPAPSSCVRAIAPRPPNCTG